MNHSQHIASQHIGENQENPNFGVHAEEDPNMPGVFVEEDPNMPALGVKQEDAQYGMEVKQEDAQYDIGMRYVKQDTNSRRSLHNPKGQMQPQMQSRQHKLQQKELAQNSQNPPPKESGSLKKRSPSCSHGFGQISVLRILGPTSPLGHPPLLYPKQETHPSGPHKPDHSCLKASRVKPSLGQKLSTRINML